MKYSVTFTAIGNFALDLLKNRRSLIIFDKDVHYSYEDVVVSHTKGALNADICAGDRLTIAEHTYTVSGVGAEANANLRESGHVTLHFVEEGSEAIVQPGEILLVGSGLPRIMVGDTLTIA